MLKALLCLVVPLVSHAELPPERVQPPANPPPAQGQGQTAAPANRGIQIFDDRVFKLSVDEVKPTTRKSPNGSERTLAEEPDYNTAQREQWIQTCSPQSQKSQRAFKDCFEKEKRKSRDSLNRRVNEVESRQAEPLRNQPPIVDEPKGGETILRGIEIEKN